MKLFDSSRIDKNSQPLAYRMRPRNLDEYIGQDHIVGPGRLLRRAIQADRLSSVIFYGPPGTGKTTLARVIAETTKSHFSTINAVLSGVKELREEIEAAKERRDYHGTKTILFVDEVHRWNKSQQDALLPWVENGTFILIGATTENPFFEVNAALVSRSRIFQLKQLTDKNLMDIAKQALANKDRGYGNYDIEFEEGALDHLVNVASGDARSLLNALELAVETTKKDGTKLYISKETAEESIQQKAVLYDKEGDYHFDVISAFIKSIRGSDPDASLYWLAKMVRAGEDPKFIFRRMLISATEDVGLADPNAIVVVQADAAAFSQVGLPEGRFHLAHAALYLSTAPKSNSALGFFDALNSVINEERTDVPNHLRDASRDAKGFGHGEGYLYPHAYKDHWVAQQYLPSGLQGKVFYNCGSTGYEAKIAEQVSRKREIQIEETVENAFPESLTYSPGDNERNLWVNRTIGKRGEMLEEIRNRIFNKLEIKRSDRILVLNAGGGMLVWESFRVTPEGLVVAIANKDNQIELINHYAKTLPEINRPKVYKSIKELPNDLLFEHIIGHNVLTKESNKKDYFSQLKNLLTNDGDITFAETIPSLGSRLSSFFHQGPLQKILIKAEKTIYSDKGNYLANWNLNDLEELDKNIDIEPFILQEERLISTAAVKRWLEKSYLPNIKNEINQTKLSEEVIQNLTAAPLNWQHQIALLKYFKNN